MNRAMRLIALAVLAVSVAIPAIALAGNDEDAVEVDVPITGVDLQRASAAALGYLGGGVVTGTEVGDEESYYEIEVTLDHGRQVDVQLDENFVRVMTNPDVESD